MRLSRNRAARRRLATLAGAALAAFVVGLIAGGGGGGDGEGERTAGREKPAPPEQALEAVDRLSLRQQVGQVTISTFPDPTVPDYIRRRLRAGETAGVILFSRNAGGSDQWAALTGSLQRIARDSALVMVDQEGGDIRTVSWAGPEAGQPLQGDPPAVRRAARSAARQLRSAGVNVNLAPVADVPGGGSPVMGSRSFAGDAAGIAARTRASIEGMAAARLAATAKHFPGLGRAQVNTDDGSVTVQGGLDGDLVPFRAAIEADVPLVMLSHALYPALDERRIASQSPRIVTGLLRDELGYDGVAVTDSLEAQAVLDRSDVATAAERSLRAGVDLILTTGSASWNDIYPRLLERARRSKAFRERIRESAARVLALKERLGLSATPRA